MIRGYSDHAANERTFLAWVRTGIAVVAFGFVVAKFNLFLLAMASTRAIDRHPSLERLSNPIGRYDGLAITLVGLALIVAAAVRFIRVRRLIADQDTHDPGGYGAELALSATLALVVVASSAYAVLGW